MTSCEGFLEPSFLLQLPDKAVVDQLFSLQFADLFVGLPQQANHVADAVDARVDFLFLDMRQDFVAFVGLLDALQAQPFHQDFEHDGLVFRLSDKIKRVDQAAQDIFDHLR